MEPSSGLYDHPVMRRRDIRSIGPQGWADKKRYSTLPMHADACQVQKMRWRVEPEEVRMPEKPRICCCITERVRIRASCR